MKPPEVIPIETQETYPDQLLPDNQLGMESTPGRDSGDDKDKDLRRSECLNQIHLIDSDDDDGSPVPTDPYAGLNFKNKTPKKETSQFIGAHLRKYFSVSTCLHWFLLQVGAHMSIWKSKLS